MSVKEVWGLQCPRCGDDSHIDICASLWVRLTVDGTDADWDKAGGHEWDGASVCQCCTCDRVGTVMEFTVKASPAAP